MKIFVGEINKVAKQRVVSGKTAFVSRQQERKNRKSALFPEPQSKMFIFCFSFIFFVKGAFFLRRCSTQHQSSKRLLVYIISSCSVDSKNKTEEFCNFSIKNLT